MGTWRNDIFECTINAQQHGYYVPGGLGSAEEELGSVGVGSSVCHGQDTGSGVFELCSGDERGW